MGHVVGLFTAIAKTPIVCMGYDATCAFEEYFAGLRGRDARGRAGLVTGEHGARKTGRVSLDGFTVRQQRVWGGCMSGNDRYAPFGE